MSQEPHRASYPLWVRIGLWELPNRASVWAFFWISIACAVAGIIYGFHKPRAFFGSLLFVAALMYWLTIRWVDRRDRWS